MISICLASGVSSAEAGMTNNMDAAQAAIKNFDFIGGRIRIEISPSSKGKIHPVVSHHLQAGTKSGFCEIARSLGLDIDLTQGVDSIA